MSYPHHPFPTSHNAPVSSSFERGSVTNNGVQSNGPDKIDAAILNQLQNAQANQAQSARDGTQTQANTGANLGYGGGGGGGLATGHGNYGAQIPQGGQAQGNSGGKQAQDSRKRRRDGSVDVDASGGGAGGKNNRLRKACDSCSIRKVKCDESGPPCKACAALEIPCTFERPSRRRGPPNRHAEAIKRRRMESTSGGGSNFLDTTSLSLSPTSPSALHTAYPTSHNILNTLNTPRSLTAEDICPLPILEKLVDDFFTYIHPLAPMPHEPSFRAAFTARADLTTPSFLALLASMVSTLIASFPRKPMSHLKAAGQLHLFPNSIAFVERCHSVAVAARGPGYLDRELSVYDACTSYFLGLTGAYTVNWRQCRLYFGETLNIMRVTGAHRLGVSPSSHHGAGNSGTPVSHFGTGATSHNTSPMAEGRGDSDLILRELGRRVFYTMYIGIRSMEQLGATFTELAIPPSTPTAPYPPLPLCIDDEFIHADRIDAQPRDRISRLQGFRVGVEVYLCTQPLAVMELCRGVDELFDWSEQKRCIEKAIYDVKAVIASIPEELKLRPGTEIGQFAPSRSSRTGAVGYGSLGGGGGGIQSPPLQPEKVLYYPHAQPRNFSTPRPSPAPTAPSASNFFRRTSIDPKKEREDRIAEEKRRVMCEIQKANIYASQLGTRSYLVEKFCNLYDAQRRQLGLPSSGTGTPPNRTGYPSRLGNGTGLEAFHHPHPQPDPADLALEARMHREHEEVVQDLLRVLSSISQVNMEPNGSSFLSKIRQIALTLLDAPRDRKNSATREAESYLEHFTNVLARFQGRPAGEGGVSMAGGEGAAIGGSGRNEGMSFKEKEDEEEEELRRWADLKEAQRRFAESGGFRAELMREYMDRRVEGK